MAQAKSTKSNTRKAALPSAHAAPTDSRAAPSPSSLPTRLDYDATIDKGRRRAPTNKIAAEHVILPESKRKKLLATTQDQQRNASLAAWMVRRHLDYVSRFRFQFRTGKEQLDTLVNRIFDWHAAPRNFDIAGRFGREEMYRMFEHEKVTAGDAALVKLFGADSLPKMQSIESDMLAFPKMGKRKAGKRGEYEQLDEREVLIVDRETGAIMSDQFPGKVDRWCICNRGWDGKQVSFDHLESASNVQFDGYFTRLSSQVRGVSPLSTAINSIQDLYENFEWNLLKAKVHAIFGVAVMRDATGAMSDQEEINGFGGASGITTGATEAATASGATESVTAPISATLQKLNPDSIMMVDMEAKGRIDTIESKTPSQEFQSFSELVIRICLLALDMPFTAFDSKASSFSGMIADQNFYEQSCRWKRDKNRWVRQDYSDWLLWWAWNDESQDGFGLRAVANEAGITRLRELQEAVSWIPNGSPWLQKLQEIEGDCKSIAAGLDNSIDACQRRGADVFENIDKQALVIAYAESKGVPLVYAQAGQPSVGQTAAAEESATNPTE